VVEGEEPLATCWESQLQDQCRHPAKSTKEAIAHTATNVVRCGYATHQEPVILAKNY